MALERRSATRQPPHETSWLDLALLRPGQEVLVVNLSSHGALLESARRMLPGTRAQLQLANRRTRCVLSARVLRCIVYGLDPICYRAAIVFEHPLAVRSDSEGSG